MVSNWGHAGQILVTVILCVLAFFLYIAVAVRVGRGLAKLAERYRDPARDQQLERQHELLIVSEAISSHQSDDSPRAA